MLSLTKPATQSRLNAAVVEVIGLNVMGPVYIPGEWDVHDTILYAESKLKKFEPLTLYQDPCTGTFFFAKNKKVHFTPSGISIHPTV
jgi:hypothetical protein